MFKRKSLLTTLTILFFSFSISAQQFNLPYQNDFETAIPGWTFPPGLTWAWGVPQNANFQSLTGSKCMISALNCTYGILQHRELVSPKFNLVGSTTPYLSFWFRSSTDIDAGFYIDYTTNGGTSWSHLGYIGDPNARNWYNDVATGNTNISGWSDVIDWTQASYSLSQFSSDSIQFKFVFESLSGAASFEYGVQFDNFMVSNFKPIDATVIGRAFDRGTYPANISLPHGIIVKNAGEYSIDSLNLHYSISGGTSGVQHWQGSIAPGGTDTITVALSLPAGLRQVTFTLQNFQDFYAFNDTFIDTIPSLPITNVSYADNFEFSSNDFYPNKGVYNKWQWGTPAWGVTIGAHSGTKCWDVNLNSGMQTTVTRTDLYTPFFNIANQDSLRLGFSLNYLFNQFSGMDVEYSLDTSMTWHILGTLNDPNGLNWYDSLAIYTSHNPIWTGNSNGWKYSRYDLPTISVSNIIQFRFSLDTVVNSGDGISMDDFYFTPAPEDATLMSIVKPEEQRPENFPSPFIVRIKNSGKKVLTSASVQFNLNGVGTQTFNWTGFILPEDSLDVRVGTVQIPSGSYTVCAWINIPTDVNHYDDSICVSLTSRDNLTLPYSTNFDTTNTDWEFYFEPGTVLGWDIGHPTLHFSPQAISSYNCLHCQHYGASQTKIAYTPYYNFTNVPHPAIRFWQYRALNTSRCWIEYMIPDSVDWTVLGMINDTQNWNPYNYYGNPDCWNGYSKWWMPTDITADVLANVACVRFRLVLESDSLVPIYAFGILIDNFEIYERKQSDAEVVDIQKFSNCQENFSLTPPVNAVIRNAGTQPLTSFIVNYSYDTATAQQSWSGNLNPFETVSVQLPPFTALYGHKTLKIWVSAPGDTHSLNDTLYKFMFGDDGFLPVPFYDPCEDNIGSKYNMSYTGTWPPDNQWLLGYPTWGVTTGVHDGLSCWDVNPGYRCESNGERSNFHNRIAFLTDTITRPLCLTFWQNRGIRNGFDEFYVQFSQDGSNWRDLSTFTRLTNETWEDTWTGGSGGWKQEYISLRDFNGVGPLYLRFELSAWAGGSAFDGVSVDDIRIDYNAHRDAAVVEIKQDTINFWPGDSVNSVSMLIRNIGLEPITSFTYGYNVEGYQAKQGSWTGTLEILDTIRFTLPGYVSPNDSAIMNGWVTTNNDGARENDTLHRTLPIFPLVDTSFTDPYDGWNYWTKFSYRAWAINNAQFMQVPPWSAPRSLNVYAPFNADSSVIYSPVFDFDRMHYSYLRFMMWYKTSGGVTIQYTLDKGSSWTDLGSKNDPFGTNWFNSDTLNGSIHGWTGIDTTWKQPNYNIGNLNLAGRVQFRFYWFNNGPSSSDQIQIDNFELVDSSFKNLQLVSIDTPVTGFIDNVPAPLIIHVSNSALTPSGGFQVRTTIDGGSPRLETVNGTVLPNGTVTFALQPLAVPLGSHTVCATIELTNDVDTSDNDICITVEAMPLYLAPFSDNFDGVLQGWRTSTTGNLSTQWEMGIPVTTAYSIPNAWDVNLTSNYFDGAQCSLTSPWIDMTTLHEWLVSFYSNYSINSSLQDGARLRFQFYEDSLTSILGTVSDPFGTNWYSANLLQGPSWQGSSGGWIEHFFRLNSIAGFQATNHAMPLPANLTNRYAHFIFEFESDNDGVNDAGYSMDNFFISSTVNVKPVKEANSFNVFPVPTTNQLIIQCIGKQQEKFSVMLYDLTGHKLKENSSKGETLIWSIAELPSGIYILRITANDGTVINRRVVKE